jgi:hypothetical protein
VLVKVGRTLRNVDVDWDYATRSRTSKELVRNIVQVDEGIVVSAGCGTTSRTLKVVKATARLATRTPHTTSWTGHDSCSRKE